MCWGIKSCARLFGLFTLAWTNQRDTPLKSAGILDTLDDSRQNTRNTMLSTFMWFLFVNICEHMFAGSFVNRIWGFVDLFIDLQCNRIDAVSKSFCQELLFTLSPQFNGIKYIIGIVLTTILFGLLFNFGNKIFSSKTLVIIIVLFVSKIIQ